MRKPLIQSLILSLSVCVVPAGLVGCGNQSNSAQVSEQLDVLLDHLSRMEYAAAPLAANKLSYTYGVKNEAGMIVPGTFDTTGSYVDQLLALLPDAKAIAVNGNETQKKTANAIIASILADEGAYLLAVSNGAFQDGVVEVATLRDQVSMIRSINAHNKALAGERTVVLDVLKTGINVGDELEKTIRKIQVQTVEEVQQKEQELSKLAPDDTVGQFNVQSRIDSLMRLGQINGDILSNLKSYGSVEGLNQLQAKSDAASQAISTTEAKLTEVEGEIADLRKTVRENEALDLKLTNESRGAEIKVRFEKLSAATTAGYNAEIAQAKVQELQRVAVPLLQNQLQLANKQKSSADEVIGQLKEKIADVERERLAVADKLAELSETRSTASKKMLETFTRVDAQMQARTFDRLSASSARLAEAQKALTLAGKGKEGLLDQMSLYTLRARVLHQQALAARTYGTTIQSILAAGDIVGGELSVAMNDRLAKLTELEASVNTAVGELDTEAAATMSSGASQFDGASAEGAMATSLVKSYSSLLLSVKQGRPAKSGIRIEADDDEGFGNDVKVEIIEEGDE